MKKLTIFLVLVAIVQILKAQDNIAVYVVGDGSAPSSYDKIICTAITQAINEDGNFKAVERLEDFKGALTSESAYQQSGAVSQSKLVEFGQQFGANYIFAVDLTYVLGELYASSRIINAKDNVVEAAYGESANIQTIQDLKNLARTIATQTMAKLPYNVEKQRKVEAELSRKRQLQQISNRYKVQQIYNVKDLLRYYST